jgi:NADPH:quinone reductase-like Zn-dependent oxidoreductase
MSGDPIPNRMRALEIDRYEGDPRRAFRRLRVATRPVPMPAPGQVLVRIEAAACNPSDLTLLAGHYGICKTLPAVPGWEGAGIVVAHGGGSREARLIGRRVSCASQSPAEGTWAEFFVTDASSCFPLRDDLETGRAAYLIVNPLTALVLLGEASRRRARSVVLAAGAGQLARMVVQLARRGGLPLITVVRNARQAELLAALGADPVLSLEAEDFDEALGDVANRQGANLALDAVGGSLTGRLLAAMPARSTAVVLGALSAEPSVGVGLSELVFRDQRVEGFWLGRWLTRTSPRDVDRRVREAQELVVDGTLATGVRRTVSLEETPEALREYLGDMSGGKLLIVP